MRFRRTTGLVFLGLGLVTLFDQLGYLNMNSVVFLALAILGGCLMVFARALTTYRTGLADYQGQRQSRDAGEAFNDSDALRATSRRR